MLTALTAVAVEVCIFIFWSICWRNCITLPTNNFLCVYKKCVFFYSKTDIPWFQCLKWEMCYSSILNFNANQIFRGLNLWFDKGGNFTMLQVKMIWEIMVVFFLHFCRKSKYYVNNRNNQFHAFTFIYILHTVG